MGVPTGLPECSNSRRGSLLKRAIEGELGCDELIAFLKHAEQCKRCRQLYAYGINLREQFKSADEQHASELLPAYEELLRQIDHGERKKQDMNQKPGEGRKPMDCAEFKTTWEWLGNTDGPLEQLGKSEEFWKQWLDHLESCPACCRTVTTLETRATQRLNDFFDDPQNAERIAGLAASFPRGMLAASTADEEVEDDPLR